jgi:hypothetical protein
MSQVTPQPSVVAPSNSLGIAGFVCSLVGLLVTGGILCPVGVVLSLVALSRPPRGFAVAGLIVGLLGMCGWAIALLIGGAAILAALGLAIVGIALSDQERVEITRDMATIAFEVRRYERENRYLPATLEELELRESTRLDPWGERYRYNFVEAKPGFELTSAGEDRQFSTDDDVALSTLGERWKAGGLGIDVSEDEDTGRVRINLGPASIEASGDDDSGRVTIDLGHRVIEIVGDETGGSIDLDAQPPDEDPPATAPEPPTPPDAPDPSGPPRCWSR